MVLPFVPVIPAVSNCALGCAKKAEAIGPMALRTEGTST